jgi:hypothetical protein
MLCHVFIKNDKKKKKKKSMINGTCQLNKNGRKINAKNKTFFILHDFILHCTCGPVAVVPFRTCGCNKKSTGLQGSLKPVQRSERLDYNWLQACNQLLFGFRISVICCYFILFYSN